MSYWTISQSTCKKHPISVSLLLTCCNFSSLSLFSGIQGSSICRLTVLWSWITGIICMHIWCISTDPCAWTGFDRFTPHSVGACGCRAGEDLSVRHIMDRIWNGLSAALDSLWAQHSLWMKTGKVSLPRKHCNHPKPMVYCMERISFTFMLSAFERPSSWMVKISEQFYDGFLRIAACRWIHRALSHEWCNQRAAKACYCAWMD